jgi:hypothetical protein
MIKEFICPWCNYNYGTFTIPFRDGLSVHCIHCGKFLYDKKIIEDGPTIL